MQQVQNTEKISGLQRCDMLAQGILRKYEKRADPGSIRKALAGVIIFCFGTFVTFYVTLGPAGGRITPMSFIMPGFFLLMTVIMLLELRNHYLWRHNQNAYVLKYLQKEASKEVEIRYVLGYAYQAGALGIQDSKLAAQWYGKAAGYPFADNDLGVSYAEGDGVPQDLHRAQGLFKKAAAGGALFAPENLKVIESSVTF